MRVRGPRFAVVHGVAAPGLGGCGVAGLVPEANR